MSSRSEKVRGKIGRPRGVTRVNRLRKAEGVYQTDQAPLFDESMRGKTMGWYPPLATSVLGSLHDLPMVMVLFLTPLIGDGSSGSPAAQVLGPQTLVIAVVGLPIATWVARHRARAGTGVAAGALRALATWHAGFGAGLLPVRLAEGTAAAAAGVANPSLLMDVTPAPARVRAFSMYHAVRQGTIAAGALVAVVVLAAGSSWQSVMLSLGVLSLGAVVWSARLVEPSGNGWDPPTAGALATVQSVLRVQTVRRLLGAYALSGTLFLPGWMHLLAHLDERWEAAMITKLGVLAIVSTAAAAVIAALAAHGEDRFRRDPRSLALSGAAALAAGSTVLAVAPAARNLTVFTVGLAASFGLVAVAAPFMHTLLLSTVPREVRPYAGGLAAMSFYAGGALVGVVLLGTVERRFGTPATLVALAGAGVVAAFLLRKAADHVNDDLDRVLGRQAEHAALSSAARRPPLLSCSSLNFSYGQVQVLFDVDLEVEEGELVALLGTNGAGKSTLLSLISGLDHPSSGTIRFEGADITSMDAEHRLALGISQIPGGKAVFGPMTVAENLRVYAHSYGRSRRAASRAIDTALEAFPRLQERRNHTAATLSGGEQQMLGLSKALILEPRLLLIDELSLGLAPVVVDELLERIKTINTQGTAVILVEQSVTTALSLSPRAYFMEKGEIRFSGKGSHLLRRKDLLRSVFLEGATAAVGSGRGGKER